MLVASKDANSSKDFKYDQLNSRDVEVGPNDKQARAGDKQEEPDDELKPFGGQYDRKMCVGQVTIRLPLNPNPLNLLALMYGFLPWIIPIAFGVHAIVTRHFMSIYALCITASITILNEAILKPLLKQPRPRQTANREKDGSIKPGMPSGHVYNATGLMVWALCEVGMRGPGYDEGPERTLSVWWLVAILLLMAPVPWARWYNYDHTAGQCAVSLVLGTITGAVAFYFRMRFFSSKWKYWDPMLVTEAPRSLQMLHPML